VPLSILRKTIAQRMEYSKTHIPHACGMDIVDMSEIVRIREKEKTRLADEGITLTYLPFIIKACVAALSEHPALNAHFDDEREEIVLKARKDIGIAVDTDDGLMVVVIKEADRKSLRQIASEIHDLAGQARSRRISLNDVRGSTFTITNVGSVGGLFSTPVINPPEVAILGVHRIKDMPMAVDGQLALRKGMGISLCFDHRALDGAEATRFMNRLKELLEDPALLFMGMV